MNIFSFFFLVEAAGGIRFFSKLIYSPKRRIMIRSGVVVLSVPRGINAQDFSKDLNQEGLLRTFFPIQEELFGFERPIGN